MAETPDPKIVRSAAYALFIEEVEKHLQDALSILLRGTPLDQAACTKLGSAFHTIRGSSGFFGLATIASVSKELEMSLLAPNAVQNLDLPVINGLVTKLHQICAALPRPNATTPQSSE